MNKKGNILIIKDLPASERLRAKFEERIATTMLRATLGHLLWMKSFRSIFIKSLAVTFFGHCQKPLFKRKMNCYLFWLNSIF